MTLPGRCAVLALCLSVLASAPALAGDVWSFLGSVGANAGRAANPTFVGALRSVCDTSSSSSDPNDPRCDPLSPSYDPTTSSQSRRGDTTGSLRLTGGATGKWDNTYFDLTYSPTAYFYYERSHLNQVGHDLSSSWRHNYTPRVALNLSEYFRYTPEQDLDPNNLQQNNVITRRTSRTNSNFRSSFGLLESARTTLTWSYSNVIRAFSSPDLIDSTSHNAGFQWKRRMGRRSFVSSGYEFAVFSFGNGEPGSDRHQANVGYGFESPRGFNLAVNAGYNVLLPDDPTLDRTKGIYTNSSIGWNGRRLAATTGYTRGFSDGGGVYTSAQTESSFADLRFTFTPKLSSNVSGTRNVHERLQNSVGAATTSDIVRSFNGRASLNYQVAKDLGLNVSYAYYRQGLQGLTGVVPGVRSDRYSIGITWSSR